MEDVILFGYLVLMFILLVVFGGIFYFANHFEWIIDILGLTDWADRKEAELAKKKFKK